ncbi:MAG: PhzF family phenazine biosynthesis protein [Cyanobacteria bacterium J083]|nr:MAG: PhzF family phenazine biosynthesis protein [Cyanobacteria bacterium J083]
MKQTIIQVDAFTNKPFTGNPAAVCILESAQPEEWMQNVASEMNLSETAFLLKQAEGYSLRWFTPTTEVPLCGHATLASSHVLWTKGYLSPTVEAKFFTLSGILTATLQADWIELNFPANLSRLVENPPPDLAIALGIPCQTVWENSLGYLVEVESANLVRNMQPNFAQLNTLPHSNVIVTSRGEDEFDFVSRFFAPGLGINEDPVTGAAHCCLAPFWRNKLQKDKFLAWQASPRGGVLKIRYTGGERVFLAGQAVTVMEGQLL